MKKIYTSNIANLNEITLKRAGLKSQTLLTLLKSSLSVQPSFVILTNAFDEHLITNSLIEPLSMIIENIDYSSNKTISKASKQIQDLISMAEMPLAIKKEIISAYKALTSMTEDSVTIIPSYQVNDIVQNPLKFDRKRAFMVDDLINAVKDSWLEFFTTENLRHRNNIDFEGDLTLALIVQKGTTAESSGVAFNFDTTDNNTAIISIEAVYGIWDDRGTTPDIYKVSKRDMEITEKYIGKQEKMIIRTKDKRNNYRKIIKISNNWKESQKVLDTTIDTISTSVDRIEQLFDNSITILWSKEADQVIITDILIQKFNINRVPPSYDLQSKVRNELQDITKKSSKKTSIGIIPKRSSKDDLRIVLSGTGNKKGFAWGIATIVRKQEDLHIDNPKTILVIPSKYNIDLDELSTTIANGIVLEDDIQDMNIPTITNTYRPDDVIIENELITIDSDTGDVFTGTNKTAGDPGHDTTTNPATAPITITKQIEIKTALDVYIELNQQIILPKEIINIDGGLLSDQNQIINFAKSMNPKPIIYDIDTTIADSDFLPKIKLIHKIRNQENYRNIWISFSNLKDVEKLQDLKKTLTHTRLRRSSTFKVLLKIDTIPAALSIPKIFDIGIDGIIIDVKQLTTKLFGTYKTQYIYSYALTNLLEIILKSTKGKSAKIWLRTPFITDFIKTYIKKDLFAIIVSADRIHDIKTYIANNELKKLKVRKKRGRRRKS